MGKAAPRGSPSAAAQKALKPRLKPQRKLPNKRGGSQALPLPPSKWPPGAAASKNGRRPGRPFWLPGDWACGVKTTCRTYLPCFIGPDRKMFYHKVDIEKYLGVQLGPDATKEGAMRWALDRLSKQEDWHGEKVENKDDGRLFALLSKEEKAQLPHISAFHVGVVSARRAGEPGGMKDIVGVEVALRSCGVKPRWYVDAQSLDDYLALGLDAIVGGKLTPARNMVLEDAAKQKKLCVQVSDDISRWQYWNTSKVLRIKSNSFEAQNAMAKSLKKSGACMSISPGAAMRFMAAKMRAAGAKLCGVYPQANIARAFTQPICTTTHFILGDFFVADLSPVRFDESMTLKEDYDYTCAHLAEHGQVLRCNRMIIVVKHATNAGGAVSVRDGQGIREQQNIQVLMRKWPHAFRRNPTRANEVILAWKDPAKLKVLAMKAAGKLKVLKAQKQKLKLDPCQGFPPNALIKVTDKGQCAKGFVGDRCRKASGMKVASCLSQLTFKDGNGATQAYKVKDLKYDLAMGRLKLGGSAGKATADLLVKGHWSVKPKKAAAVAGA